MTAYLRLFEAERVRYVTLANGSAWKLLTGHGELEAALDPDGTRGYRNLVRGAVETEAYGLMIKVAALEDVIRSKEAADRPRDRAVLPDVRRTLELKRKREAG